MTTTILTAALAFITTFGFSSLLMQFAFDKPQPQTRVGLFYSKPTNKQVLRFLERDIKNGQERMSKLSHYEWHYVPPFSRFSLEEYREAVGLYVQQSGSMDDSDLPQDLQIAWRNHMKAWRDYSEFLNTLENLSVDESNLQNIRRLHKEKDRRISSTWFEVLEIAGENYGAYPANAY